MDKQKGYIESQCIIIEELVAKIKKGDLGEFTKVTKIHPYRNNKKQQDRVIIDVQNAEKEKKQINLLASRISKALYINIKSYEFVKQQFGDFTDYKQQLDDLCDADEDDKTDIQTSQQET
jgi:hypothetical protein